MPAPVAPPDAMTRVHEKLSAVDTAWLRMDRPSNLMMICSVLLFRGHLSLPRVRKLVDERFCTFARFRQRPVVTPSGAYWDDDPRFDIARHVVMERIVRPGGRAALQDLVSRLIATSLDPAHPLWRFHVVPNYDGGSAVIIRIHHCYADGIALVRVLLSMTDAGADGPPAMPFERHERPDVAHGADAEHDVLPWLAPFGNVWSMARKISAVLIEKGAQMWTDPAKALELAEQGTALSAEVARLALMQSDSPTSFKGVPGRTKRVAWADPIPLDEVKVLGKALHASVNDVLLSCVAGALRGYLASRGETVSGVTIRALVPVNLRPMEKAWELGNHFGLVFLDLPIGIENPVERLYAVRANMHALKSSMQPIVALGLLAAMGTAPRILQEALLTVLARNATAVMTNVPGPPTTLYLAGARIDQIMFWVPQSGDIGVGVSIISFNDAVQFGMVTDRGLCPHPEKVIERFGAEFETLLLATLMSPWPREGDLDPAQAAVAVGA